MGLTCLSAEVHRKNERSSRSGLTADFAEQLKDILECPVCYELLRPPVLQCVNGHSVCVKCRAYLKGKPCPVCKGKMEASRNLVAEALCQRICYPCRYKHCPQSLLLRDLVTHEAGCAYRQYSCPLVTAWHSNGSVTHCSWPLPRCEILGHAEQQHPTQVWRGSKHHVTDYNFTSRFQKFYLISAYDEIFLWGGQYMPKEHKFFGALKFEGPVNKASEYIYTFTLSNSLGRATLKVERTVLTPPFESIFGNESCCVVLDLQTIKRFSQGDKLCFVLQVDSLAGKDE
ncbi:E3 ubiquitin-protein ligase sina [Cryptotermes secundus]|uniref:E3 ubiquitin-protein ligase sina n=1 Tax=Cryptotermes secundus TaxID=105785 RepID=UPI000CD7C599|nr:E3 ubiquitin-protein ligase sina [Cryptotermes secundus]